MGKKSRAEAWLGRTRLQGLTVDKKNDFGAGTAMLCNAIPMSLFSN